jgi:hypothetical protein
MRIHQLAMLAILTAAISTACGSAREVRSTTNHSNAWGCDQCHGYPPPPFFPQDAAATHPAGLTPAMCTVCHPLTVQADGHSIVAGGEHRDGQVQYIDYHGVSCAACHALPPDTGGHNYHVTAQNLACSRCHKGYDPDTNLADDTTHMNGTPDVVLDNGYRVTTYDLVDGTWPDAECKDCHDHRHDAPQ